MALEPVLRLMLKPSLAPSVVRLVAVKTWLSLVRRSWYC
jgi:hypothetical protein